MVVYKQSASCTNIVVSTKDNYRQPDRQTDGQTMDSPTDRWTAQHRQIDHQTDCQIERQTNQHTDRQTGSRHYQTGRHRRETHLIDVFPLCVLVPDAETDGVITVSVEQMKPHVQGLRASHPQTVVRSLDNDGKEGRKPFQARVVSTPPCTE